MGLNIFPAYAPNGINCAPARKYCQITLNQEGLLPTITVNPLKVILVSPSGTFKSRALKIIQYTLLVTSRTKTNLCISNRILLGYTHTQLKHWDISVRKNYTKHGQFHTHTQLKPHQMQFSSTS